jgi:hypothetical protein
MSRNTSELPATEIRALSLDEMEAVSGGNIIQDAINAIVRATRALYESR